MAKLLEIVEGWTEELGPFTLKADGAAVDLSDMTVALILRNRNGQSVTVEGTTRISDTPTDGQVYYTPDGADLLNAKSPYSLRWEVTDGAGRVVFFPNGAPDTISVFRR